MELQNQNLAAETRVLWPSVLGARFALTKSEFPAPTASLVDRTDPLLVSLFTPHVKILK